MRRTWLAAFVVAVALAVPAAAQANEVTNWNRIAMSTLVVFPGPAGGAPPALQINMAMVQGAVYDAINATEPKHHRPYLLNRRFGSTASQEAAAATAAYRVLSSIVSGVPLTIPFPNRASLLTGLATQYDTSKAAIPESPFKRMGINAGNAAADAMIAARMGDGRFGPSQWKQQTRRRVLAAANRSDHDAAAARPDAVGRRGAAVHACRAPRSSAPPGRMRSVVPLTRRTSTR